MSWRGEADFAAIYYPDPLLGSQIARFMPANDDEATGMVKCPMKLSSIAIMRCVEYQGALGCHCPAAATQEQLNEILTRIHQDVAEGKEGGARSKFVPKYKIKRSWQTGSCHNCHDRLVEYRKWQLCNRCYDYVRKYGKPWARKQKIGNRTGTAGHYTATNVALNPEQICGDCGQRPIVVKYRRQCDSCYAFERRNGYRRNSQEAAG